jgi:Pyridoxamine 5'-phosphate oxidase
MSDRSEPSSVRLTEAEAWTLVAAAHTGIFTSLRRDGTPISLPLWFVVDDHTIWLSTPASSKKVTRVRNNPRTSFLVESGERWAELAAVHLTCTATVVEGDEVAWVEAEKARKYGAFRTARRAMPERTRDHYGGARAAIRLDPDARVLTWDNSRLGPGEE